MEQHSTFDDVYAQTHEDILRFIVIRTNRSGDVEDIFQEVYRSFYVRLTRRDAACIRQPKQYLYAIARKELARFYKRRQQKTEAEAPLPATLRLVIEEESSREGPTTVLLEAELGEVTFRCAGYSRHQTVVEGGSNAVTLSGRHCVTVEDSAHAFDKQDPYRTYTMYAIDLDGVRLQITDVERTATGITDMAVDIRFPESMSETDVDRFCKCIGLYFRIHVDGVADGWVQGGRHIQRTKDDARHAVYHTGQLYGIPLELLPELREIALTPVFASSQAYCFVETAADGAAREGQPIPFEEGVAVDLPTDPEGGFYFRPVEQTVFSDCAMTIALP